MSQLQAVHASRHAYQMDTRTHTKQRCLYIQLIEQWKKRLRQSYLCSHHVYKDIWSPVNNEILEYERETDNHKDCYMVLCKENFANIRKLIATINEFVTNVH